VDGIRERRREGKLSEQINIRYNREMEDIYIWCDRGRIRRPLLIVKNGKVKMTEKKFNDLQSGKIDWNFLVREGIIEYIDADEEEDCLIALDEEDLRIKTRIYKQLRRKQLVKLLKIY